MWFFSSKTPDKNAPSKEFLELEAKAALQGEPKGELREQYEPIPTRRLGDTNTAISQIGLGCMRLTESWRNIDLRSVDVIHAALDGGVRFFDTARWYSWGDGEPGQNEKIVARALKEWPHDTSRVLVSTKVGMKRKKKKDRTVLDGSPEFLRSSVEGSLKDLELDRLSLVHLQEPDPKVPLEDSLGELVRLKDEGKIRHIGLCNMTLEQLELACSVTRIASVQYRCNPWWREAWRLGILEYCEAHDITLIAH
ncbi:MAG: aldo/keto reductase, partial [Myxococcota bacterium]|nr:aldo/keto reductase [Myxococcota bacterium]